MKKLLLILLSILPLSLQAQGTDTAANEAQVKTVKSPHHRIALLELYTSEGCSSCPPADRFLTNLKASGISDKQVIAMAFHVTYWDYIGWKDRFASKQYDHRQRTLAQKNNKTTIYTPQFILAGDDYRRYATFSEDVGKLVAQKATVDLELSARVISENSGAEKLHINLISDTSRSKLKDVGLYFAVIENNLSSDVSDGENEGETLHHDYVVRQFSGPHYQSETDTLREKTGEQQQTITLNPEWKKQDLSIIAFAEDPHTGEVLQAVRLKY